MIQQTTLHNSDTRTYFIEYQKRTPFGSLDWCTFDRQFYSLWPCIKQAKFIARLTAADVHIISGSSIFIDIHPIYESFHMETGDVLLKLIDIKTTKLF